MLKIYPVILELIGSLRSTMEALERRDGDLARQMRRASSSVALNTAEGMYSRGKNRAARYHTALGSVRETQACLEVAVAMGYVESIPAAEQARFREITGTLVRLVERAPD